MRLGLLTSGGDCAGLNAVIRAVVTRAVLGHGWQVLGIRQATHGLLSRPVDALELTPDGVAGVLHLGGTLLGTTNRDNPFAYPAKDGHRTDRSAVVAAGYHELRLDALIGVGGDGSLGILRRLAGQGDWKLVGIPKTIDNDVRHTEHAIGFNSAVAVATEAVDRLHVTAASHSRVMVLEVMGRDAGHIALAAGIAGGADVILIPEIPYTMAAICGKIEQRPARPQLQHRRGRRIGQRPGRRDDHHDGRARPVPLWRHRRPDRAGDRRAHRRRDPGHGPRPRAAGRRAGAARSRARLGVRRLCRRSGRGRPLRSDGRLAEPPAWSTCRSPRRSPTTKRSTRTTPWCIPRVASASPSATRSGGTERSPHAACSPTSAAPTPASR